MAWVNKNFSYSTLNGGVLIGATSMVVTTGANFPASGNFMCVIWDQSYANPSFDSSRELVLCTARSTNTITITRAQEGTSAKAWNSGDKVAHVYTAGILDTVVLLTATQTLENKTLVLPTIGATSWQNAVHDHSSSTRGGTLSAFYALASGTLMHERGGLEADVSAYDGLVKISGGATSQVTAPTSTIVGISDSQTLSNKTLAGPIVSGSLISSGGQIVRDVANSALALSGTTSPSAATARIVIYGPSSVSPNTLQIIGNIMTCDASDNPYRGIMVEDWTSITSFNTGWTGSNVGYMKDPMGFVHLKGYITAPTDTTTTPCTLGSGYRPSQTLYLGGSGAYAYTITTGGVVTVTSAYTNYMVKLDGVSFKAA